MPTCICNAGVKGSINGIPFHKDCKPRPGGDLLQQKNPTCWVETYQGGLQCCHHDTILLDKDQTPPEEKLTYHLKFRFYFQPYTAEPPSHRNLLRMWHQVITKKFSLYLTFVPTQTEENSGEYDVIGCPAGTPPSMCTYQITSHFTVQEMVQECDLRKAPTCWGNTTAYDGINLIYAAGTWNNYLTTFNVVDYQVTAIHRAAFQWSCTTQTLECCSADMTLSMARLTR